jgi:hypothetical protein
LVAASEDIIHYASGAVGVIPEEGTRWMAKDPDSGEQTMVEMVKAVRSGNTSLPKYKVRRIDNGKEITLNRPWISPSHEACGGDMMPAPIDGPPQGPSIPPFGWPDPMVGPAVLGPDMPPDVPFGHIIGEDNMFYIVQIEKPKQMNPSLGPVEEAFHSVSPPIEPPPYGRFPGDVTLSVPPRMENPLPFPFSGGEPSSVPSFSGPTPATEQHGPAVFEEVVITVTDGDEDSHADFAEEEILEDVEKQTTQLKFKERTSPDPVAPSGAEEEDVIEAISKLKSMFKGDPRIKEVRRGLSSKGKPVLYLHSTMPRSMKDEVPKSLGGFQVILAPLHDSLVKESKKDEDEDTVADSLVNPLPNRPQNGKVPKREYPPGPYLDQVSGPPPSGDVLVTQVRDIPKGR